MSHQELTDALKVVHEQLAEADHLDQGDVEKLRQTMSEIQAALQEQSNEDTFGDRPNCRISQTVRRIASNSDQESRPDRRYAAADGNLTGQAPRGSIGDQPKLLQTTLEFPLAQVQLLLPLSSPAIGHASLPYPNRITQLMLPGDPSG